MAGLIEGVNQRTQLAGENRLEMLLFHLGGKQAFGINVFKIREVIQCPKLTILPKSSYSVRGIVNIRGITISIIDLRIALGLSPVEDPENAYIIVTEYNRQVQGLLVNSVDKIINMNWADILPPPDGMGNNTYLTAVTNVDDNLIQIIDVEKILDEVIHLSADVSEEIKQETFGSASNVKNVLVVDDSAVARNQIKRTIKQLGVPITLANDGQEALNILKKWADQGDEIFDHVSLVISDIEMPKMDGYTLTSEIRKDPRLKKLFVILHTSLSGGFNSKLVDKVGADRFIPKFEPDDLAKSVIEVVQNNLIAGKNP
jgi:two-component system chemotaxis response regulator CheV